ncbi:unnamed protein product [Trifolium pratense]|uniref:Uncharacterized protein n=1 Tax=Trifolium pratense TaxID=57577 RepID=A0ACB0KZU9_TRIPR|nr:unnamed protein product [Trifolium pratense]
MDRSKICWVSWDSICQPKDKGGLGIKILESFNDSLLCKWKWRCLNDLSASWFNLLHFRYGSFAANFLYGEGREGLKHASIWWRDMWKTGGAEEGGWFVNNISSILGDGNNIAFWKEKWLGMVPLSELYPSLFQKSNMGEVAYFASKSLKKFKPSFAPFVDRPLGPPWFTHRFPSPPEFETVTNNIWTAYLMPTVLSCRIGLTSGDFGLVGYFPNLVSRQFGLTQILPKSIYLEEREVCLGKHGMTEPQFHSFLNHFNQPSYELTPFDFAPSHACTREFFTWWSRHYEGRLVDKTALLTAISNGFDSSILNKIKSKLNARGILLVLLLLASFLPCVLFSYAHLFDVGSKSKAGSSDSSKPLPPPSKVELQIASRKRPHSTETPSVSKKQKPVPAPCSSAPDEDTPVLSTIPEHTTAATTQDLFPSAEPITDEKKKKKKKKKEHQPTQESTPERKSSEIEAQPDTLASPEDPPLEQSERKKKKKKKQKKSPAAAAVQEMIIAALHFFESSTNTFHFECGMMTPTLLDVAAITGLSPLGDTYDPCKASDTIKFDFRNKSYSKYIVENRKTSDEVSDEEHIAFLTLWLSQYVFCTQSLQVAKKFIPMAIQLHECQQFNFARLILGCLYESMRDACEHLKRTGDGSTFLGAGPFWLLQLWLTATFHAELDLFLPEPYYEESRTRRVEGTRLARMVPRERGLGYDVAFQQYFNTFLSLKKFKPSFAPFVDRPLGPPWFTHRFPSPPEFEMVTNSIWNAYLMPTVLSCRIGLTSGDFGLVGYFPNLVSRQFGLTQILPKSIYLEEREVCLGKHGMTEPQFHSFLNHFNQPSYELTPFDFAPSHACTREFFTWWSRHYEGRLVDKTALLTAISNGFDSSILNKIKSKLNARGSKSKAGSSDSSKPLPPPSKVELQIASRKRPHSTETPSVSKKQKPVPATCSSAPDKDIPVLSTIPEHTTAATTQDLFPSAEPITDEKKKKKKKKKERQTNQESTPERKSSEIEAQTDTLASPEDPPLEQSERKKKKKKKQKKSPAATTVSLSMEGQYKPCRNKSHFILWPA